MARASLSRGDTSVSLELYERSGNPLVSRDVGKPQSKVYETSKLDPRFGDQRAGLDVITIIGQFRGSDAYTRARTLSEDLVKPHSGGVPIEVDLSQVTGFGVYDTVASEAGACRLHYPSGQTDWVSVQLSLNVVSDIIAGSGGSDSESGSGSGSESGFGES